jgi:hypothetical protein
VSEKPTVAFVLSLLAGIFILLRGGLMSMRSFWFGGYGGYGMMNGYNGYGGYSGYGGMMNSYGFYGMMRGLGIGFGIMGIFGLVFGIIVIISALMLHNRPSQHTLWGILIIIFSTLSVFGGMLSGLELGLILGIIGGILAIVWKPHTRGVS